MNNLAKKKVTIAGYDENGEITVDRNIQIPTR